MRWIEVAYVETAYEVRGMKARIANALGKRYDEVYGCDAAQRLKTMDRGTLAGSNLTNPTFAQCWSLDPTGNWKGFREDADGNGTWDLVQSRTANAVNEITDVTNTTGAAWIDPAYNRAGNMTTMPRPSDPTQSYTATYDAWNRLVKLAAGANTVSEYVYDGAKRRIVQKTYNGGTLSETRHLYYTEPAKWQVLEERLGTSPDSAAAERRFVWGLRYIDDLVLRDRDTDGNGTLDERLYACQDANWNVTAVVNGAGTVQERYSYTAYGQPMYLTATFAGRTTSSHAWETLYCGYRYEAGTGLFHVRHRVLHPIVGVWVQRDPLKHHDGMNILSYCIFNPATLRDAYGTSCRIGYHCWTVIRFGFALGTHCGLTVTAGGATFWIDVLGGGDDGIADFSQVQLPPPRIPPRPRRASVYCLS